MKLRLANDLVLGDDLVVSTTGIFATKGAGKSHLAQVMAEEMLEHGQVIVAIDPTDAWWGLRASADGRHDGYPVVVIGGDHGDLKLEPGAAVQLAEAVVAERFSCVICTDGMSDLAETKFVREFLDTVYRKNRDPIHIFVDESDVFAPQKPFDVEDARCIRAMSHIVRRGRKKGIGSTLITQRPAELNASVRTMVEMLFVLGMSHNLDIDAVERWMRVRKKKRGDNTAFSLQEEMIASLDTLQRGDAWVWAPRLGIHQRFRAREKRTFDSGATPRPGQKVKAPKKLAPVDLQRLGQAMSAAVQRQKDNDPAVLRQQLADLRRTMATGKAPNAERSDLLAQLHRLSQELTAAQKSKAVEVVKPADLRRLEAVVKKIEKIVQQVTGSHTALAAETSKLQAVAREVASFQKMPAASSPSLPVPRPVTQRPALAAGSPPEDLKPAHLRLLSAIAWWESVGMASADLAGVAFIAKTSTKSSAFDNNRSHLRARGYIDYPSTGRVTLTEKGRAIAPPSELPPTNAGLHAAIFAELPPAIGRLLRVLIEAYPQEVAITDLAERANTSWTSSAFDNNRSWLRARGLAEYPRTGFARATALLFPF